MARIIEFRGTRRAPPGLGPIGVVLPLAVFTAALFWPTALPLPMSGTVAPSVATARIFARCTGPSDGNCVIDGDTFRLDGRSIRIADIDTPETHPARCAEEDALGLRATDRLGALLSAGPFDLVAGARDRDVRGRDLRVVTRDGHSLGQTLIDEGLARPWQGRRRPWCGTSDVSRTLTSPH